jgi:hypothetical protein
VATMAVTDMHQQQCRMFCSFYVAHKHTACQLPAKLHMSTSRCFLFSTRALPHLDFMPCASHAACLLLFAFVMAQVGSSEDFWKEVSFKHKVVHPHQVQYSSSSSSSVTEAESGTAAAPRQGCHSSSSTLSILQHLCSSSCTWQRQQHLHGYLAACVKKMHTCSTFSIDRGCGFILCNTHQATAFVLFCTTQQHTQHASAHPLATSHPASS